MTAAITIGAPRLRAWLDAPVRPASSWQDWAGVAASSHDELRAAVEECDGWLSGDHAGVLRDLVEDELLLRYDESTGALVVEFASRADFRLPTLVWACAVLRGLADFMADDDRGLVTVTNDWDDDTVLLHLGAGGSAFLDRARDARRIAEAHGWEIDVRAAALDADEDVDWLHGVP